MRTLTLNSDQRQELDHLLRRGEPAHMRQKAQALLLVHQGIPAARVARDHLMPARQPDTLYRWLNRYEQGGIAALRVQEGRGRKPAFFRRRPRPRPAQGAAEPACAQPAA